MATYYVFIPNSEAPTAEVDAPSTKHARTAYLDYLSRSGTIEYSQRGTVRKVIRLSRMQPGEVQTSVKLEYGLSEPPEREVGPPPYDEAQRPSHVEAIEAEYAEGGPASGYSQQPREPTPLDSLSPIMRLSRKTGGL